jgi:glycosyltransferase involved in cell wall biosynthesis
MITLSVCMIVKNEEDVLGRCLDCVKYFADEIIIVDTGSNDRTKEIAAQYTDKIYDFEWIYDFAAARNFSFSKATKDYVMWLDADDVIDKKNRRALKELKRTLNPEVDMVMMKYDVAFDEHNNPTFSYYRERIFKRSMEYRWVSEIHEVIEARGKVIHSPIAVYHKKIHPTEAGRNLRIFQNMILNGKQLDPRQQFYYARELYYNDLFNEAINEFNHFLQEGKGWVENNISACQDLAKCYYKTEQDTAAIEALFRSFLYDEPRAEICCEIGKHFFERNTYTTAIFWYKLASERPMHEENGGFVTKDSYGITPFLQICVCYDRLGNYEKAAEYNEMAGKINPDSRAYLYNKKYFDELLKK